MSETAPKKKKFDRARIRAILRDAGDVVWRSRRRLLIGIPILLVNRLSQWFLHFRDGLTESHVAFIHRLNSRVFDLQRLMPNSF